MPWEVVVPPVRDLAAPLVRELATLPVYEVDARAIREMPVPQVAGRPRGGAPQVAGRLRGRRAKPPDLTV